MSDSKKRLFVFILYAISLCASSFGLFILGKTILFAGNEVNNQKIEIKDPKIEEYDISEYFYFLQEGKSSWYGKNFHNRRGASGERFDMHKLTAAHRKLPFGTIVRVKNLQNNRTILLRITDRGPFVRSRIIDLSYYSAKKLDALGNPPILLEALVYDPEVQENLEKDYLFGYSYNYPLVCLPRNKLKIIGEFYDFDEAINEYEKILGNFPSNFLYLLVPPNQIYNNIKEIDSPQYFIGFYQPFEPIETKKLYVNKDNIK